MLESYNQVVAPIYHQIAVDIAAKIANGKYKEGERMRGRSMLASQYNVSPETIRRAIFILQDMGIVRSMPNVGIEVISMEKAAEFVAKFRDIQSLTTVKNSISTLISNINAQNQELEETIRSLVEQTERYKVLNPFMPFELEVRPGDVIVGKTISEVSFWHNTRMTIVGIKRGNETILSPGPHLAFQAGDIIVVVGDEESFSRAKLFLSSPSPAEKSAEN